MKQNEQEPHPHAELIKAKVDNMKLVTFVKTDVPPYWEEMYMHEYMLSPRYEFYACHPKNKRAVLHWLKGGNIEQLNCVGKWEDKPKFDGNTDSWLHFLHEIPVRIKCKKEPRWIGVDVTNNITTEPFNTEKELTDYVQNSFPNDYQPIKIFVDVAI